VLSFALRTVESGKNVGTEPYIESVFENDLVELDAAGTLAAAEANEHTLISAETRRLQIAAHWADLHSGDAIREDWLPGAEHPGQNLGGWQVWQPEPGTWLWRSPHGWIYLVNATGTHSLRQHPIRPSNLVAASQPQDGQAELTTRSLR
jgi:hypothetical protein